MEDEEMFQHILRTNQKFNVLYVIDTRPMVMEMHSDAVLIIVWWDAGLGERHGSKSERQGIREWE